MSEQDKQPTQDPAESEEDKYAIDDPRKPEEVVGLVKRCKVFMTQDIGEVSISEFTNCDVDGAPIIECFSSIGLVSVLTGKQLIKDLNLPLIAVLQSEHFQVSCVVASEQPSTPVRVYGNKSLVVFICETNLKVPPEAMRSLVECIMDFAHRHKSPMVFSLEGMPKEEKIELPTGEEVSLSLKGADEEAEGEEEENYVPPEKLLLIDDSILAKLTLREDKNKPKPEVTEEKKSKLAESDTPKKKKSKKKGISSPQVKSKKKSSSDDPEDEDEDEKGIEEIADELFGNKLHYVTTHLETAKKLRSLGYIPVVDGIIPGITGGLLSQAPLTETEVTALLVPTSTVFPDPDSSIVVLKAFEQILPDIKCEKCIKSLEKEGANLKKMMSGLMQGLASGLQKSQSVPYGMYQ
eukprot:TRINITY_DN130_c0_g1_i1.p1 TRINITY_DN130_c0_g1~~TRINITY_DN130_c0_g1_i1.p1  ORF type:complete len:407 (-),score=139.10 TRINITY_DN130_c0_g1_i1:81-1301(-)